MLICRRSFNTAHIVVRDGFDVPAILPDPNKCLKGTFNDVLKCSDFFGVHLLQVNILMFYSFVYVLCILLSTQVLKHVTQF